jgi:hypothetical protein
LFPFPFRAFVRTEPNVSNRSQELKESIRIAINAKSISLSHFSTGSIPGS